MNQVDATAGTEAYASTQWEAHHQLIATRLTGDIHTDDVASWQSTLDDALAQVEEDGSFKLLVDLSGYELHDMAAHKAMRVVIPQLVAVYGLRPALLDFFPEVEMTVTHTRGISCRAVANVHHDVDKMTEYERIVGRADQRFFTDTEAARAWLLSLP
jgi:hypothetical protein